MLIRIGLDCHNVICATASTNLHVPGPALAPHSCYLLTEIHPPPHIATITTKFATID